MLIDISESPFNHAASIRNHNPADTTNLPDCFASEAHHTESNQTTRVGIPAGVLSDRSPLGNYFNLIIT